MVCGAEWSCTWIDPCPVARTLSVSLSGSLPLFLRLPSAIAADRCPPALCVPVDSRRLRVCVSSIEVGQLSNTVELDAKPFATDDEPWSWVLFDFLENSVRPERYALAQPKGLPGYMRFWQLEGSVNNLQWDILSRHNNDSSVNSHCRDSVWNLRPLNFYRYIRLVMDPRGNSEGSSVLTFVGFEVYGEMLTPDVDYFGGLDPEPRSHRSDDMDRDLRYRSGRRESPPRFADEGSGHGLPVDSPERRRRRHSRARNGGRTNGARPDLKSEKVLSNIGRHRLGSPPRRTSRPRRESRDPDDLGHRHHDNRHRDSRDPRDSWEARMREGRDRSCSPIPNGRRFRDQDWDSPVARRSRGVSPHLAWEGRPGRRDDGDSPEDGHGRGLRNRQCSPRDDGWHRSRVRASRHLYD